ncbi:hypothetical protein VTO58DRAFT_106907 [Aureobasidium pullulans]
MANTAGFDGILIDMKHSSFDLDTTGQLCTAALYVGITLIIRAPSEDPCYVSSILDGGALVVIAPHIRSVQDAKDPTSFPVPFKTCQVANSVMNEGTLAIPMIETLEALELVEEVAAVEGVDSLLIGTNDPTAEMGIPGDYDNPGLTEAYEKIIAPVRRLASGLALADFTRVLVLCRSSVNGCH